MPNYDEGDDRPTWHDRDAANAARIEYSIKLTDCLICFEQFIISEKAKFHSVVRKSAVAIESSKEKGEELKKSGDTEAEVAEDAI